MQIAESFALVDTNYQRYVLQSAGYSGEIEFLGPNRNKLIHLLLLLPRLHRIRTVVIGDFRSGYIYIYLCIAAAFGRKIVLSDDGLVSHILDRHGFSYDALNDGTVKPIKRFFLNLSLPWLSKLDRLSSYPEYTHSLGKKVLNEKGVVCRFDRIEKKGKLLFIGQVNELLGIQEEEFLRVLNELALKYSNMELHLSLHPRFKSTICVDGWNPCDSCSNLDKNDFSYVATFSSTAVIDFGLSGSNILLIEPPNSTKLSSRHSRVFKNAQSTIREIINYYDENDH